MKILSTYENQIGAPNGLVRHGIGIPRCIWVDEHDIAGPGTLRALSWARTVFRKVTNLLLLTECCQCSELDQETQLTLRCIKIGSLGLDNLRCVFGPMAFCWTQVDI